MYTLLDIAHLKVSGNVLIQYKHGSEINSMEVSEADFNKAYDRDEIQRNISDFAFGIECGEGICYGEAYTIFLSFCKVKAAYSFNTQKLAS